MVLLEDLVEDILLRSDPEDLLRCKSVCKSWYSLISTPRFVKAHLKKTCNNNDTSNTRIVMPTFWKRVKLAADERQYQINRWKVVGSSNGLVCVSRPLHDGLILVNNPWTREVRTVPMAPIFPEMVEDLLCLSFGYDASTDDYKVVMGIRESLSETLIQVFSLKSNTWKIIGRFNYSFLHNKSGILFNGSFYWVAFECNNNERKKVILSFDLSREDFTIIPQPNDSIYSSDNVSLGIAENQLCAYFPYNNNEFSQMENQLCSDFLKNYNNFPHEIWVMRSYNVEQSWERLPNYNCVKKYEVVLFMSMLEFGSPKHKRMNFFCADNKSLPRPWKNYIIAHIFMPSLVSPYVNSGRPSHPKNDACCIEVAKGEWRHTQAMIGNFFKASEKIEETYRLEVGEAENLYLHEDGET